MLDTLAGVPTPPGTTAAIIGLVIVPGVVLMIWAYRRSRSVRSCKTEAVSVSGCLLIIVGALFLMLSPVFRGARLAASRTRCESNMHSVMAALMQYHADNDERNPLGSNWCDALGSDMRNAFRCSELDSPYGFSMNARAAGVRTSAIADPDSFILVFDGPGIKNHTGGAGDVKLRHLGATIGYSGSRVRNLSAEYLEEKQHAIWDPKEHYP